MRMMRLPSLGCSILCVLFGFGPGFGFVTEGLGLRHWEAQHLVPLARGQFLLPRSVPGLGLVLGLRRTDRRKRHHAVLQHDRHAQLTMLVGRRNVDRPTVVEPLALVGPREVGRVEPHAEVLEVPGLVHSFAGVAVNLVQFVHAEVLPGVQLVR
jgi:hypothetical protein